MRSNWFKSSVLVALTGACLWFTPGTAEAQWRGGGGGSRGGVVVQTPGGFSVGVGNTRGYGGYGYGGYGYGNYGGYRGGYYDRGYYDRGYSYPRSSYYGYGGRYSDSYYSAPAYRYSAPSTVYTPETVYYEAETPTRSSSTAQITVHVPSANAEIWLDGQPTSQRGMQRTFVTPRLNAGSTYTYEIKARWMENGQPVEQTRSVRFQTGQTVRVDFNQPS